MAPLRLRVMSVLRRRATDVDVGQLGDDPAGRAARARPVESWVEQGEALPADAPDARRVSLYLGAVPVLDDGTDW